MLSQSRIRSYHLAALYQMGNPSQPSGTAATSSKALFQDDDIWGDQTEDPAAYLFAPPQASPPPMQP